MQSFLWLAALDRVTIIQIEYVDKPATPILLWKTDAVF